MFLADIFGPDLLIVVLIGAVLLFGGAAIPKFARNLGSAKSEFEKGLKDVKSHATLTDTEGTNSPTSESRTTEASD